MKGRRIAIAAALVLAAFALIAFVAIGTIPKRTPVELEEAVIDYVVDGDTIDVVANGNEMRVRLIGIDCPESASHDASQNTVEGALATAFVKQLLPQGHTVYLQKDEEDKDKYGRFLRYVWLQPPDDARNSSEVATKMANAIIVEEGYADTLAYWPNTTYEDEFDAAKERALAKGAGISYAWAS